MLTPRIIQAIKHHASSAFATSSRAKLCVCYRAPTNFTLNALINGCGWVFCSSLVLGRKSSWLLSWFLIAFQFVIAVLFFRQFITSPEHGDEASILASFYYHFFFSSSRIERAQSVAAMHRITSKVVVKSNKLQTKSFQKSNDKTPANMNQRNKKLHETREMFASRKKMKKTLTWPRCRIRLINFDC